MIEIVHPCVRFALPNFVQPEGTHYLTSDIVEIDNQKIIPVCLACHLDYRLPTDERIIGNLLNHTYIDWETSIALWLNHQDRRREPEHGPIIERVNHSVILFNAAVIFEQKR